MGCVVLTLIAGSCEMLLASLGSLEALILAHICCTLQNMLKNTYINSSCYTVVPHDAIASPQANLSPMTQLRPLSTLEQHGSKAVLHKSKNYNVLHLLHIPLSFKQCLNTCCCLPPAVHSMFCCKCQKCKNCSKMQSSRTNQCYAML
jgi:hypothetical protein